MAHPHTRRSFSILVDINQDLRGETWFMDLQTDALISSCKQPKLKRSTLGYQETNETFTQQDLSQLELQLPNLYFRTND